MAEAEHVKNKNSINIADRKLITVTGVTKVCTIEENQVLLLTECGKLRITGKDMEAEALSVEKGTLSVKGVINACAYLDRGEKDRPSLKRLFS